MSVVTLSHNAAGQLQAEASRYDSFSSLSSAVLPLRTSERECWSGIPQVARNKTDFVTCSALKTGPEHQLHAVKNANTQVTQGTLSHLAFPLRTQPDLLVSTHSHWQMPDGREYGFINRNHLTWWAVTGSGQKAVFFILMFMCGGNDGTVSQPKTFRLIK